MLRQGDWREFAPKPKPIMSPEEIARHNAKIAARNLSDDDDIVVKLLNADCDDEHKEYEQLMIKAANEIEKLRNLFKTKG